MSKCLNINSQALFGQWFPVPHKFFSVVARSNGAVAPKGPMTYGTTQRLGLNQSRNFGFGQYQTVPKMANFYRTD